VAPAGTFEPELPRTYTLPAAGGLWATAADLVRISLGWLIYSRGNAIGAAGGRSDASASLLVSSSGQQARAAVANRWVHLDTVTGQLLRACGTPPEPVRT
jgi:hypothetical protein